MLIPTVFPLTAGGRLFQWYDDLNEYDLYNEFYTVYDIKMEEKEIKEDEDPFLRNSEAYWAKVPANIDGMLGGFSCVSPVDIQTSTRFLKLFLNAKARKIANAHALDCGAGIGRVTKHLLSNLFEKVDMVEQNPVFLQEAKTYLGEKLSKVDRMICSSLQNFCPEEKKYDVIWVQWVCSCIDDEGIITFLTNVKAGLNEQSVLFLKENVSQEEDERDDDDCSITRTGKHFRSIIRGCGYVIMKELKQNKFPQELYEVRIFACRLPTKNTAKKEC